MSDEPITEVESDSERAEARELVREYIERRQAEGATFEEAANELEKMTLRARLEQEGVLQPPSQLH